MAETRTIVVNGKTHTLEERPDGDKIEVIQRDETGNVVAWYWRKAAPDAAAPMVASTSRTIWVGTDGVRAAAPARPEGYSDAAYIADLEYEVNRMGLLLSEAEKRTPGVLGASPPFERASWQHAVDDQLSALGKTSEEFATPHDAVRWLLQVTGDAALACQGISTHGVFGKENDHG